MSPALTCSQVKITGVVDTAAAAAAAADADTGCD